MKAPGSKMALHQGVLYSNHRNNKKKIQNLLQNHFAQILKFNMKHCLMVFYQICSNGGVQNGPPQRVLGLNHRNRWKKRGWSGGAMVLGKLPVPGRPTNLD